MFSADSKRLNFARQLLRMAENNLAMAESKGGFDRLSLLHASLLQFRQALMQMCEPQRVTKLGQLSNFVSEPLSWLAELLDSLATLEEPKTSTYPEARVDAALIASSASQLRHWSELDLTQLKDQYQQLFKYTQLLLDQAGEY